MRVERRGPLRSSIGLAVSRVAKRGPLAGAFGIDVQPTV